MNAQNKKEEEILERDKIILRNFPKSIFFMPLFLVSIVFSIIQSFLKDLNPWLGFIWVIIFFSNLSVTALDFPSNRVLILILISVIIILLAIFLGLVPALERQGVVGEDFNIGLSSEFYIIMTIILGLILGMIFISTRFDYYIIERNEVIHRKGIFSSTVERFPVRGLRIKKEIPDLFEYFMFKAGSITLEFQNKKVVNLNTILNIKKKAERIDFLLSSLYVIME